MVVGLLSVTPGLSCKDVVRGELLSDFFIYVTSEVNGDSLLGTCRGGGHCILYVVPNNMDS